MVQVFTNTPTAVTADGALPFQGFKNLKGCTARLNSGAIALNRPGVYSIIANFSFNATLTGSVAVTQTIDGTPSTTDIARESAAAGEVVNLTIPSLVTVDEERCQCGNSVIVGYTSSASGTLVNANAIVTKLK